MRDVASVVDPGPFQMDRSNHLNASKTIKTYTFQQKAVAYLLIKDKNEPLKFFSNLR